MIMGQVLMKLAVTVDPTGRINAYVDRQNAGVILVDRVGSKTG